MKQPSPSDVPSILVGLQLPGELFVQDGTLRFVSLLGQIASYRMRAGGGGLAPEMKRPAGLWPQLVPRNAWLHGMGMRTAVSVAFTL
jgi:hypothetical protein